MEFIDLILIPKLDRVRLKYPHQDNVDGTLCITGHHMILSSRKEGVHELWLLHKNIDAIEKKEIKGSGGIPIGGSLTVKCKDLRIFQLEINGSRELNLVAQSLESLSSLSNPLYFYPFFYRPMFSILENGYTLYSIESEFAKALASDQWRLSTVNSMFSVCQSYGKTVLVPKDVDDECVAASATFRQGGRFPVLSYKHSNGACLLRAGQPLYGSKHRRCRPDEKILNSVISDGMKGVIYDLRSTSLISQQQNKGGGTESNSNYSQWKIYNRTMDDVDNHQQLLESFSKLVEASNDRDISMDRWLSKMESSGWLESVRNSLHTACIVAQHLHQKAEPVLVHGTKGQDATLIVCSIVQVILNPDCRTVRGLQALIEREWLQGGHPFGSRHRWGPLGNSNGHSGASFALFLDCLRQFLEQFPCSFEFSQALLLALYEHSYASQFGTFIGDSEYEREQLGVKQQSTSLWSWLNRCEELPGYLSAVYEPTADVIWPSVAPVTIVLWEELFLRWTVKLNYEERDAQIKKIKEKEQQAKSQAIALRKELMELAREYYGVTDDKKTKDNLIQDQ